MHKLKKQKIKENGCSGQNSMRLTSYRVADSYRVSLTPVSAFCPSSVSYCVPSSLPCSPGTFSSRCELPSANRARLVEHDRL